MLKSRKAEKRTAAVRMDGSRIAYKYDVAMILNFEKR